MDKFFALKLSSNDLFLCLVELQKLEFEATCKLSSTFGSSSDRISMKNQLKLLLSQLFKTAHEQTYLRHQ
jgi:hypothetical protein